MQNFTGTLIVLANGTCGSSGGGYFTSAPTTGLCSAGNATAVTGSGPWNWTCQGIGGGTNASCSANVQTTAGVCGTANGQGFTAAPTSNFCSVGNASAVHGTGPWTWTCAGLAGGATVSCAAILDGACGSANTESFLTAPRTNLCSAGRASALTGTGPWSWTCQGSGGAPTNASCAANLKANGACGTANAKAFTAAPATNLCTKGTPSALAGSGPWTWTCVGLNGGTPADCSAKLEVIGACGSATANSYTKPTSNFCSSGTPSAVTGEGPWNWTCAGSNGGATARCSAKLEADGVCGTSNTKSFTKAPATNLCAKGTASAVTGSGPWDWSCQGLNGGTAAPCSATLAQPVQANMSITTTGSPTVIFTDASTGSEVSRQWDFGDGTPDSTLSPVSHTFKPGSYTVKLTVKGAAGDTESATNTLNFAPTANFTVAATPGKAFTVTFTDTSTVGTQPTHWLWDFGDNTPNSTTRSPVHTYPGLGTYTVTLTVSCPGGSNVKTMDLTLN